MELQNKKVTVMGLGLLGGGIGTTKWLKKQGAEVLVTDLKSKQELKPSLEQLEGLNLKYVLGEHRPQDFKQTDLVVKNPAVPTDSKFLEVARENNVPVETEISLFFKFCPCPIIGVTGTKGKSTVATLTYNFLENDHQVILGGNIKTETLPKLNQLNENSLAILELSSWQLSSLEKDQLSPHGAIITNIKRDHLNRYQSFENYVADKSIIYKYQTPKDHLVLNYRDEISSRFADSAESQVHYYNFGVEDPLADRQAEVKHGATIKNDSIVFEEKEICKKEEIKLSGRHNLANVLAAVTMAKIYQVEDRTINQVLKDFEGLPHRLEPVEKGAVDFYNDSCATNPAATIAALNSFDRKPVLIAGGAEKDLEFEQLAEQIAQRVKALILLPGEATPRLKRKVQQVLEQQNKRIPINQVEDMEQAVRDAFELAQEEGETPSGSGSTSRPPQGIVLLSPACSSFGQFVNEFDRGEKFKQAVRQIE